MSGDPPFQRHEHVQSVLLGGGSLVLVHHLSHVAGVEVGIHQFSNGTPKFLLPCLLLALLLLLLLLPQSGTELKALQDALQRGSRPNVGALLINAGALPGARNLFQELLT